MSRLLAYFLFFTALLLLVMNLLVLSVHTNAPICTDSIVQEGTLIHSEGLRDLGSSAYTGRVKVIP